jgi:hypothetical protein
VAIAMQSPANAVYSHVFKILDFTSPITEAILLAPERCNSPKDYHAMITRRANTSSDKALDAFMTAKFQIDAMLDRLTALSTDHFDAHPDEINWSAVGTLNHYASLLREVTDAAFKEGEHAA